MKKLYKLYFYYENNILYSAFKDFSGNITKLDEQKTLELLSGLKEDFSEINNVKIKNNISFYMGELKIILLNSNNFKQDDRFNFLFSINKNNYKLVKEVIIKGTIIGLSLTALLAAISYYTFNNDEESLDSYKKESFSQVYEIKEDDLDDTKTLELLKEEQEETYNVEDEFIDSEESQIGNNVEMDIIDTFKIGSEVNSQKAKTTRELYHNIFENYCAMYGLDTDVLCALGVQEEGVHSPVEEPGGALGLMQPQLSVWDNQDITVYDDEGQEIEVIHITKEKLKDVDFNIKVGCAIFKSYLQEFKGNYPLAIVAYNMGDGKVNQIINRCIYDTNLTREQIIDNPEDCTWTKYIYSSDPGDPEYLMHTGRYIPKDVFISLISSNTKVR